MDVKQTKTTWKAQTEMAGCVRVLLKGFVPDSHQLRRKEGRKRGLCPTLGHHRLVIMMQPFNLLEHFSISFKNILYLARANKTLYLISLARANTILQLYLLVPYYDECTNTAEIRRLHLDIFKIKVESSVDLIMKVQRST